MAHNQIEIRAAPDDIFRVLLDPRAYGFWVVGPDAVVEVDDEWPQVGSSFTHQTKLGPVEVRDVTELEEIEPPRRLALKARIGPAGVIARISFELSEVEGGTCVTMVERPIAGVWRSVWNPVFDRLLWARNSAALQRLRRVAESLNGDGAQAIEVAAVEPGLPTVSSMASTLVFWALSKARGKRVFHPIGQVYVASIDDARGPLTGLATTEALVRMSKAIGTPGSLPDFYGLAIKLVDAWGPGADQDFLLVTSGDGPMVRHLLVPVIEPLSKRFSSILPYSLDEGRATFGARITAPGRGLENATIHLELSFGGKAWRPVARLTARQPVDRDVSFDPWNSSPGLMPAGGLNALRRSAYEGSREARSA